MTNGPLAAVFVVLAIMAIENGRKRYSAFLVPRDTPGLTIKEMPEYQALAPSRHCGLVLDGCHVPHTALLGPSGTAYEAMALPFRDVEDAVGTFGLLGAFRFLQARFAAQTTGDGRRCRWAADGIDRSVRRGGGGGGDGARCRRSGEQGSRASRTACAGGRHAATGAQASR